MAELVVNYRLKCTSCRRMAGKLFIMERSKQTESFNEIFFFKLQIGLY